MSIDISRVTFNPWKDFTSVVMQQGRVQLESDWNEWLAELTRRIRAGTLDCFGRAVYPATTPNAFVITPTGSSITIGVGRMYVDGLLVENHGLPAPGSGGWIPPNVVPPATQPAWDTGLDELVGQNARDYLQQPYFPGIAIQHPFPASGGPFIVYLDCWLRCATFLEYPDLIEKAVSVDTTGRLQTVWQVRLLDVSTAGGTVGCDTDVTAWNDLIQPSAGRLTTGVVQSSPSGPCCLAPNTGYTGMENQLYRVEIHQGGTPSSSPVATFKWSRNNASVATSVTGISQGGTVLTVQSTGRDNVLRFDAGDWVEITDDWRELNGQPGELRQVLLVTDSVNTIKLSTAVPTTVTDFPVDANGLTDPNRHTRLIKWDQKGKVYKSDGTTVWADLDAAGSTGEIPVPPPGAALILENGATISFDLNPGTGSFHIADYWNFAARTVDGTIESLIEAPPLGIHHHYARLAVMSLAGPATDCRVEWPPKSTGGEGCDCSSCVSADSHNGNTWTIQQAIDFVLGEGGGKVCLGPGIYNITATINIVGGDTPATNLMVVGHGLPTLVPTEKFSDTTIMQIQNAIDIDIDYLAFSAGSPKITETFVTNVPAGLTIGQCAYVRVERCAFGLATDIVQLSPAIALRSYLLTDCTIRENLFTNVREAIGTETERLLLTRLKVEHNQMYTSDGGLVLSTPGATIVSEVRFTNNFVQGTTGFTLLGRGLDVTVEENTFTIVAATASETAPYNAAVVCNISQTRILNNDISRAAGELSVSITPNNNGALTAGTYIWIVTAILPDSREVLITTPTTVAVPSPSNATLVWSSVPGVKGYNIYRSVANGGTLLLDDGIGPNSGTTISYEDKVLDSNLHNQLPTMQNDGIFFGVPSRTSIIYGTQVVGNRINGMVGAGISAPANTILMATMIAQNQMLNLGGDGILLGGITLDLDIVENSLRDVGQLAPAEGMLTAIQLQAAMHANISGNRITQFGPAAAASGASLRAILLKMAQELRIAGNEVTDVGPTRVPSMGISAAVLGHLDVTENDIRRSTNPPTKPTPSRWLALDAIGQTITAHGNLFQSFGGDLEHPGVVNVRAQQSCTFSDNQCFQDGPDGSGSVVVVSVESREAIIAIGNRVKGPVGHLTSMRLAVPSTDPPPITVIGNITTSGITVVPSMPPTMGPLNVRA